MKRLVKFSLEELEDYDLALLSLQDIKFFSDKNLNIDVQTFAELYYSSYLSRHLNKKFLKTKHREMQDNGFV